MNTAAQRALVKSLDVHIRSGKVTLDGNLVIPDAARGVVLFAHGSGSSLHAINSSRALFAKLVWPLFSSIC
jgi:hypothetical protein